MFFYRDFGSFESNVVANRQKRSKPGVFDLSPAVLTCSLMKSGLYSLGRKRDLPQAGAGRIEDGVGYCRRGGNVRRLAGPQRGLVRPVEEQDVDFGDFRKLEDGVGFPVNAGDAVFVEFDLFLKRAAQRLHDVAFDLVPDAIRVDDQPAVMRHDHARDAHHAGGSVHRYESHAGHDGLVVLVAGERQSAAFGKAFLF